MNRKIDKALRTLASEKWGFSKKPSEKRRLRERIEQEEREVEFCQRAARVLEDE